MGWKSTMDITREDAIEQILINIGFMTDEALAEFLEKIVDKKGPAGGGLFGHNFSIVAEYRKGHPGQYDSAFQFRNPE